MEVEIVCRQEKGMRVVIECPEQNQDVKKLKQYIEKYEVKLRGYQNGRVSLIELEDIFYFEAVDDRTFLYTAQECYEVRYRLYELEELLSEKDYIRTSKSQIINIYKMKSLVPQINRTILAELANGEYLYISRKYVKSVKEKLGI